MWATLFHDKKATDIQLIIMLLASDVGLFKHNIECSYLCRLGQKEGIYIVTPSVFKPLKTRDEVENFYCS
jgi:hypothetical protein